jgi:hypothetical protein
LPERERFGYWRDAVCQTVFKVSIEAPPERFSARMTTRSSGLLRFATTTSTGTYELVRTRPDIARAPADHSTIYLPLSGRDSSSERCDECGAGREILFTTNQPPFERRLSAASAPWP